MSALIQWLVAAPCKVSSFQSLSAWWDELRQDRERWSGTVERAVASGFKSDRLGTAFAGGYHAALVAMFPGLSPHELAALGATEDEGAHPRAIRSTLRPQPGGGWLLDGTKRWVTGGPLAKTLFVVASVGLDEQGRNRLRVARVEAAAPGVRIDPIPDAPFVPEVPHASVSLSGVRIADRDVLEGDGYERYLKPFRTFEDLHVNSALLGYLFGVARRGLWPHALCEQLLAGIAAACQLGREDASSPAAHLALAGLIAWAQRALEDAEPHWSRVDPDERERFSRDRALLLVAGKAREARRQKAWMSVAGS